MIKQFIVAPDSFKGTLTALQVCDIIETALKNNIKDAVVHKIPLSDGGEGMVDAYLNICPGRRIKAMVCGPLGEPVKAEYALLEDGTAVVEMAACAGLPLAWGNAEVSRRNPMITTTRGVGEILKIMSVNSIKKVLMGLGGSATNDGGIGMAAALGYRFLNGEGKLLVPHPSNLGVIAHIERPQKPLGLTVTAACDVDNLLCGPKGASAVYGPQKGATPQQVQQLDDGLGNLAMVIKKSLGKDVLALKGGGAAGGLGAGVAAFLDGSLQPGIEMLLDYAGFDDLLHSANMVITGEGRIDEQSIYGKVPVGVAQRAAKFGVPCIALCGSVGKNAKAVYNHGITAVFGSLRESVPDMDTLKQQSQSNMVHLADAVARMLGALNKAATQTAPTQLLCE